MAVTYYQFEQNTNDLPAATTQTFTRGFNAVGGTLQSLLLRMQLTFDGAGSMRSDASTLFQQLRVLVNGEIYFDFNSVSDQTDLTLSQPGTLGYLINSMGGRSYQVPSAVDSQTVDYYLELPMGAVLPDGVPRFEITSQFYPTGEWIDNGGGKVVQSGTITYWGIFNDATQVQTRTLASTSYAHTANTVENVVVRIGNIEQQFPGATVAGILVQTPRASATAAQDNFGNQGIRPLVLSQFGLPADLHRWANGDLNNEIMAYLPAVAGQANVTSQLAFSKTLGCLFIPLYNAKGGDIVMAVDNGGTALTRTYTPVITSPINSKELSGNRQTKASTGGSANTSKAIISMTE
tara:strand:+ start:5302 stop:6348 length:1047 start_codon:yes stop_codon:yes gene_type:complete